MDTPRDTVEILRGRLLEGADLEGNRAASETHRDVSETLDRLLRSNKSKRLLDSLWRRRSDTGAKLIAVLSLSPREGRSLLSATLARGLAEFFQARVLIVDASGRGAGMPVLEAALGRFGGSGLVAAVPFSLDHLGAGSEFRFREIVDTISSTFDVVLVDTQALAIENDGGIDAVLIARQMDASLALVSTASSGSSNLNALKEHISETSRPFLGFVTGWQEG